MAKKKTKDYYTVTVYKYEHIFQPYKWRVVRDNGDFMDYYVSSGWSQTQKGAVKAAKKHIQKKIKRTISKEVESFIVR